MNNSNHGTSLPQSGAMEKLQALSDDRRANTPASIILLAVYAYRINVWQLETDAHTLHILESAMCEKMRGSDELYIVPGTGQYLCPLPGIDKIQARIVAVRLQASMHASHPESGYPQTHSICAGIAQRVKGESLDKWLSRAQRALAKAKQRGANRMKTD